MRNHLSQRASGWERQDAEVRRSGLREPRHEGHPFCDGRLVIKRDALEALEAVLDRIAVGRHLTANGLLEIVGIAYAMNTKTRRVPRATIEAAIQGRGILTGHTPDLPQ